MEYLKPGVIAVGLTLEEKATLFKENESLGVMAFMVDDIDKVFQLLLTDNDHDFKNVFFSIEYIENNKDLNVHEIIQTVKSCCRIIGKNPVCVRGFLRTNTIDPERLKDYIKSELCSIFYLPTSNPETRMAARKDCLAGKKFISPEILEMAKPKKQKRRKNINDIELTPRQTQVLKLIRERGASNKVIARTLKLSESTVKLHVGAILKKYGLSNRTQLALFTEKKKLKEEERYVIDTTSFVTSSSFDIAGPLTISNSDTFWITNEVHAKL